MSDEVERINSVPRIPPRRRDAHKGDFGRVLVVGGSRGMPGAVALAAVSALRGGAGLVTFAAPETVQRTIASLCPCATSVPLACGGDGAPARESLRQVRRAAAPADVLAVGPGMAVGATQKDLVRLALSLGKPLVLDADGLNNLATIEDWPAARTAATVLTPHPGEFSRLTGRGVDEIQADREGRAVAAVRSWLLHSPTTAAAPPLVCLLKGSGTVVTDGRRVYVNDTGNPGMATGGSGDVLTGLVAALLAQGFEAFEAACLGAWLHGRAGDLAAEQLTETCLIAGDLGDYLPRAVREITGGEESGGS